MVIECSRYGRGKGERKGENLSKGSSRMHSETQEREPQDPGPDVRTSCSGGGQGGTHQQESLPGSGTTSFHVIANLGFSFSRTFPMLLR